jgi:hypothetical protein
MAKLKLTHLIALITNCVVLIFNVICILKRILTNNEEKISFKSNDNFIIKLVNKTYIDISNYLNNKYIIINNTNETNPKKRLKLYSVDLFN